MLRLDDEKIGNWFAGKSLLGVKATIHIPVHRIFTVPVEKTRISVQAAQNRLHK